jgi:predicted ATPase
MPRIARYCAVGGKSCHCRIVSALQREFADLVVNQPEVLAHHCFEGGMVAKAVEYYLAAAQRATAASNNKEASTYIARGTAILEQLPSSDQRAAELRKRLILKGWWFSA